MDLKYVNVEIKLILTKRSVAESSFKFRSADRILARTNSNKSLLDTLQCSQHKKRWRVTKVHSFMPTRNWLKMVRRILFLVKSVFKSK